MGTVAQKQYQSPKPMTPGPGRQHHLLYPQRALGGQSTRPMVQPQAEAPEASSIAAITTRFAFDFSRTPVHPPTRVLQTKLAINKPGDEYEQEADRIAEHVTLMTEPRLRSACAGTGECPGGQAPRPGGDRPQLQTKQIGTGDPGQTTVPPIVDDVLSAPGEPLDTADRVFMEQRFGRDFSRIRVHSDAASAQSAREVNARAYTNGHHIVFGAGWFSPRTPDGRRLLAHELTHVTQQTGGALIQREPLADDSGRRDERVARHRGQLMAKRIRTHTKLSKEARAKINSELAYFAGAAKDAYLHEVRPVLLSVTEIEMPEEQVGRSANPPGPDARPEVNDPRNSPRYVDKLFQSAGFARINGLSTLRWKENGKAMEVHVPLARLLQNDAVTAVPILEVHSSKEEADKKVLEWTAAVWTQLGVAPSAPFYSFYRTPDGVIVPTLFSKDSAPEFHKLWPSLAKPDEKTMEALAQIGNAINPFPGTKLDAQGHVGLSSNPLDWISLLHMRRARIGERARVKGLDTGATVTRTRTAVGIEYHITGMAADFEKVVGTSVYVLKDAKGNVLYVGEGEVFDRLRSHFGNIANTQEALWGPSIAQLEIHATDVSKVEALALEEDLIQSLKPLFNKDEMPFEKLHPGESRVSRLPKSQKIMTFTISTAPTQ